MTWATVQALLSHWRVHRLQLATLLIGIALATGLWSAVQAINAEARASYARANAQLAVGQFDELRDPSGPIPMSRYVELRRAGWQVAAVLEGPYRVGGRTLRLMGVDMVAYPALPAVTEAEQSAEATEPADMLTAPGRLLASPELQPLLRGQTNLPPVLITSALPPDVILTDIGVAERLLNQPGAISRLVVLPNQPRDRLPLNQIAPELKRISPTTQVDTARLTDSFHLNLSAFGLLSFAVGLFIVNGTVGLAFAQRRGMIRTLRALGVSMRRLVWLILTELTVLALIGGSLGLLLGFFLAGALLPDVAATLRGLYGAPVTGQLTLQPKWVLAGLAMAVFGTLLASGHALWRLSNMPLLEGPGVQAWQSNSRARHITAALGLILVVGGAFAYISVGGLVAGFVLLAGLLTGAALLLPALLATALSALARTAREPVSQWVWSDMRAQLPGLSLALMALLLALAANIGVSTMVSSFRLTFVGWLDQRLTAELYVTARDEDQAREITTWLRPQVDAILPIRNVELFHETGPLFLYGVVDDPVYRQHWPLIASTYSVWDDVMAGNAVLINEQLARRASLWPGDELKLSSKHYLPIAGVYSDYGNPTGQAIVSMAQLDQIAPGAEMRRFGVRMPPEGATAMAQNVREQFALSPRVVVQQAAMKAQSRAIFEKTFVVTSALNVLTLGVAGFAILTSLLTLWTQRLPQIAPVWALGLNRAQLARLELLRSVLLAALTACLALPLGLVLAWVLLAVTNVQAFGWRLPMFLFPWDWLWLFVLTLLAALIAAALPALRMLRLPPADLLRVFANER
ncbi:MULTISPECIES: FtsX-like permease family protein [unclassified Ruegeria]|uniref:FtsX-like permease family protein n=1 Tax=unclassified Ruegeria TaxID=2625375 RepID=UPI001491BC49|nr:MULTISPECIES: FtsX-like permease family protein [unclassified Ruegeria]NOD46161.1 FtsX-like permease family protein [Ruegeria sp. HKCCD5849]NOD50539.1 FtsX-like permease family protein [Ruegeria sp. HKCCD5851]NOD67355.1 FtsX-like permease family protein [Ruegeria sp. HKCCD7303]